MSSITFSKNVFIPLTHCCSNHCTYCNFRRSLDTDQIMDLTTISSLLKQAKAAGCKEALFTLGTQPHRVEGFSEHLAEETGFTNIYELLIASCQRALEIGILPHSNLGVVDQEILTRVRKYNASLGLMLESTAKLSAHKDSPTKDPKQRLEFIELAGQLQIPLTTGLLLGIGESTQDRRESLYHLRRLQQQFGHLQEVILQPVKDSKFQSPSQAELKSLITQARQILPSEVAIQVPPNLEQVEELIAAGVSDLGGISPLTIDYINPEYEWPQIAELRARIDQPLVERLPIYQRYLTQDWVAKPVWECLQREGWIS
ncbi:MAG: 7,8-didemethyl-8-hydroxy-5-deazariboflavin synthase subunit CofG [Bacillota bacterium]